MKSYNIDAIDEKMYELQKVCNRYKQTDCLADWVLHAIHRYIYSGKATRAYEMGFLKCDDLEGLVKKCLRYDRSDEGIIKTSRKIFQSLV